MAQIKSEHTFLGMDTDTSAKSDKWQRDSYEYGLNIRVGASEQSNIGAVENIKGNTLVSFSMPSGTNKCIGSHEDLASNSIFYFNWNSNGNHGIYKYNGIANSVSKIYPATTASSFLNFGRYNLITGTGFVNNMLFWTDKINPPRMINVVDAVSYTSPYLEADIDFVKIPPTTPIRCTTRWLDENGNSVIYPSHSTAPNYMNKRSYQFIYRYIYKDHQRSVWSVLSKLIPTGYSDSLINNIVLTIDNAEVQNATYFKRVISFIEIGFRDGYSDTNGDAVPFKFMKRIDFPASNGVVTYSFLNNEAYPIIDPAQTAKYFESVPLYCGALTLANNRVFTGDNIEGFSIPQTFSVQGLFQSNVTPAAINNIFFLSGSRYAAGVVFYDRADRKSGVQNLFSFTTEERHGQFAPNFVSFLMAGTPPVWATHWQIVRTASRNKSFFIQVLVDIISQNSDQFVCKLNNFNSRNVSYNFTKGDKCSITSYKLGEYALSTPQDNLQVVSQDGDNITVKLIQGLSEQLQNGAMLEFYTPILSTEIDQYYEVGEEYPVINAGLSNRRFGNDNTNTGKLITMGKFDDACGDIHFRHVTNPVGAPLSAYAYTDFLVSDAQNPSNLHNMTITYTVIVNGRSYSAAVSLAPNDRVVPIIPILNLVNQITADAANNNATVTSTSNTFRVTSKVPGNQQPFTITGSPFYSFTVSGGSSTPSKTPIVIDGSVTTAQAATIYVLNKVEAMSANDDFYENWQKNIGRVNVALVETERQIERTTQIRFGGQFIQDAQVNGLMSFDFLNQKVLPIEFGTICKLQIAANNQAEGSVMLSIHSNEIASVYLGQTTIKSAAGGQTVGLTDDIIGSVNPLAKGVGCINPESVKQFNGKVYGFDFLRGIAWRYAQNGLDAISDIGKRNYFYNLSQGALGAVVNTAFGAIDPYNNEYILNIRSDFFAYSNEETIAWSENVNRWTTFYSFFGENYSRLNNRFVSFRNGGLWTHGSNSLHNNFYGVQYNSVIKMVCNQEWNKVKILQRIEEISTDQWDAVDIATPEGQSSELIGLRDPLATYTPPQDFWKSENTYFGNVMRDKNTPNEAYPLLTGDYIRSHVFTILLQSNKTVLSPLFSVNLYYIYSWNTR